MGSPEPGRKLRVTKGTVIVHEGDTQPGAYFVFSGWVLVYRKVRDKRVVLSRLGPGQFFGEMSLITDSPWTNSVVALEDCILGVVDQDTFNSLLVDDPRRALPFLRALVERFRLLDLRFSQMLAERSEASDTLDHMMHGELPESAPMHATTGKVDDRLQPDTLVLQGETDFAKGFVGRDGMVIRKFPFKVGRQLGDTMNDIFSYNDLHITDRPPFQISRNHCAIDVSPEGYFVVRDRGSRLGTVVNGEQIGGGAKRMEAVLTKRVNSLVLGSPKSQYRFHVVFP